MTFDFYFLQQVLLALLLGGLIGIEREQNMHEEEKVHDVGGVRTMSLVALYGFVVQTFFSSNIILFTTLTAAFLALVVSSYIVTSRVANHTGITSEIAALFVYILGVMVGMGENVLAAIIGLLVVLFLYFKAPLHKFARAIEKKEWYDTFQFIAISFIVLPLLPNAVFGPLDVLNPYVIWFVVVLISSISFVSYVAIKLIGPKKGIGLGGFLGGLISSTAVAMSFSALSKGSKKALVHPFVFGIVIASTAMFFRVLLEVSVLNPSLLEYLYVPMLSMGGVGLLASLYFWSKKKNKNTQFSEKDLKLKSPFELMPAIQFGLLFAVLLFVSKWASMTFGANGVYLTAFLSGFLDVDAITVSMSNLSNSGDLSKISASIAITIAAMTNTFVKALIVYFFASKKVGRYTLATLSLVVVCGLFSLFFFL